tara:strand:- start:996 stop:1619 length:624 start_codon:yes stop_codon:yes gene_type:complete
MPNYCSNDITITGNIKDLVELYNRIDAYLKTEGNEGYWGGTYYTMFKTLQPFYSKDNKDFNVYEQYGSKWFEINSYNLLDEVLTISGDSAWSPVLSLCEKLALDYDLTIDVDFDEPGMDFAGYYRYDSSGCIKSEDITSNQYNFDCDIHSWIDNVIDNSLCNYESYEEWSKEYKPELLGFLKTNNNEEVFITIEESVKNGFKEPSTC